MLPPRSMPNSARRAHADQVWDDRSRLWTGCPGRSSLMRFDVAAHGGRSEKSAAQTRYPGEFGMTGPDFGIRGQDNCCNGASAASDCRRSAHSRPQTRNLPASTAARDLVTGQVAAVSLTLTCSSAYVRASWEDPRYEAFLDRRDCHDRRGGAGATVGTTGTRQSPVPRRKRACAGTIAEPDAGRRQGDLGARPAWVGGPRAPSPAHDPCLANDLARHDKAAEPAETGEDPKREPRPGGRARQSDHNEPDVGRRPGDFRRAHTIGAATPSTGCGNPAAACSGEHR